MEVMCKIVSINSTSIGTMFRPNDDFVFENLITWVYKNCPGDRKIIIENNLVQAQYEDRVEIYYLK